MDKKIKGPVALVILDGQGYSEETKGNAVKQANTKTLDDLRDRYPTTLMNAHGEHVGLPKGQMGNSEVGHLNIGAGRVVYQSLERINKAMEEGACATKVIDVVKHANNVHLFALVSDGGVHSHINHIIGMDKLIKSLGKESYVHAQLDGRDVPPKSAIKYINQLEESGANISSISGRFYSMDRDKRWERVNKAVDAIVHKSGNEFSSAVDYIESQYEQGNTDEFVEPAFNKESKPLQDGDIFLIVNFRQDRIREITHLLVGTDESVTGYQEPTRDMKIKYLTMMPISGVNQPTIFENEKIENTIGEYVESLGLKQMRAAETEKYPHVTFFLDGGLEIPKSGETRVLANSPKVKTYDLQPEMSAIELTDKIIENVKDKDLIIINYANPDMVGHTGVFDAVVKSVETVDEQLKRLYKEIVYENNGAMLIIADHGNAEKMLQEDGTPHTAHTTNPVEVMLIANDFEFKDEFKMNKQSVKAKLADVAPTLLFLMGVDQPKEMTGEILIQNPNWLKKVQE